MSPPTKQGPRRGPQEVSQFEERIKGKFPNAKVKRSAVEAYRNGASFPDFSTYAACSTPEDIYRWELQNYPLNTHKLRLLRAIELGVDLKKMDKDEVFVTGIKTRSGKI